MLADQQLREDIQERTGVSSRGYLIPTKKLREEARDMQRHGYKSSQSVDENQGSGNGEVMDLVSQVCSNDSLQKPISVRDEQQYPRGLCSGSVKL